MGLPAVFATAFAVHCGARSGLPPGEPCSPPGATRSCANSCGMGNELCEGGYWHACVVAPTARLCSNTCGEGQQKCVDDTWLSCTVMPTKRPCSSVCGSGTETCRDDSWGVCDAPPPQPPTLQSVIRDFQPSQPDFAPCAPTCDGIGLDFGIVEPMLGADNKPVYAGDPTTPTTHGKTDFDEWYNDVPGVNDWFLPDSGKASYPPLVFTTATDGSGTFVYDNENFFPIDGQQLFGNQGAPHNYWFTIEVHSQVLYVGGETYSVSSDDDSWTFINRRLAINLGGVHAQTGASVNLDEMAEQLGIVKGQTYPLDLFYADREPVSAVLTIRIPTTDIWSCP